MLIDFSHSFGPSLNLIWGENGSGKTTLLRLLSEPALKLSQINLEGVSKISFLPLSTLGLLPDLTGAEILALWSDVKKTLLVKNEIYNSEIFQRCLNLKTSEYSNGMRQIFKYYLHTFWNPELLLVDEPVSFLDEKNRGLIINDLLARRNNSIIFITNQEEVPALKPDICIRLNSHV